MQVHLEVRRAAVVTAKDNGWGSHGSSTGRNKEKAIFKVRRNRLDHLIGEVAKRHCKGHGDREG